MNVFVIYRFSDKQHLLKTLKDVTSLIKIKTGFTVLNSSPGNSWKRKALKGLHDAELVLIYNPELCSESDNAKWEMQKATSLKKPTMQIAVSMCAQEIADELLKYYHFTDEFEECFPGECSNRFDLYKMMVESSESLIQRRQKTNAFFITMMGSILAIGGLLHKVGVLTSDSAELVAIFCIVALLLCNSWRNLLDNYGKLNTAKFKVISHMERILGDQIFNAEWIVLGKGKRKEKYRSFTETEKNVPVYVAILFFLLTMTTSLLRILG